MSIQVTANVDGSYTVSCGGESVIIGMRTDAKALLPMPKRMPEIQVGTGVSAFVMIHGDELGHSPLGLYETRTFDLDQMERQDIGASLFRDMSTAENSLLGITTVLEPGHSADVASLVDRVNALGVPETMPVILGLSAMTPKS